VGTPPLSAQDLRAAAEAHRELGSEYSDAVVESFLAKVEARLDERVNERLAELSPRRERPQPTLRTDGRSKAAFAGIAVGVGGVGASLGLLASSFPSWGYPPGSFWLFSLLMIVCGNSLRGGTRPRHLARALTQLVLGERECRARARSPAERRLFPESRLHCHGRRRSRPVSSLPDCGGQQM
jgi:hypothetical protein